jgi:hypothetical protein
MNEGRVYCVSDYVDDGRVVWRETGVNLDSHALAVGCHGRRKERPAKATIHEHAGHSSSARTAGSLAYANLSGCLGNFRESLSGGLA